MGRIRLDDVQPGMMLEGDVRVAGARLLLTAGTALSPDHLRILTMWGVEEVEVQGISREEVETREAACLDPADLARIAAEVARLFRHADREHPAVAELVRTVKRRLTRQAIHGQ